MSSRMNIPVRLLRETEGHIVTVELKTGEAFRGSMIVCDHNWNCELEDTTFTAKDGKVSVLKHVLIRGSNVRFIIIPEMLKNSPIIKRVEPRTRDKASAIGIGQDHEAAVHAQDKASAIGIGQDHEAAVHAQDKASAIGIGQDHEAAVHAQDKASAIGIGQDHEAAVHAQGKASVVGVGQDDAATVHARVKARLQFKRGSRSAADSPSWSCKCGKLNLPIRHDVFDVPKLQCDCGEPFGGNFSFCIRNVELNGYRLIRGVKKQIGPTCVAFAYAAGLEIVKRRKAILRRGNPDLVPEMNARNLWENCKKKCPDLFSKEQTIRKKGLHKVLHMGLILKNKGIKCLGGTNKYYKPSDVSAVARDDYETIFAALANGEPLIGSFCVGRRFGRLKYCQVYKAPSKMHQRRKNGRLNNHAVVLVGGGMKQGEIFFYFLNSWGETFCVRRFTYLKHLSGVGKIRASDLSRNLVRLSKPESDEQSLKEQEITQISEHNYMLLTKLSKTTGVANMDTDGNDHELHEESEDEDSEQELSDQLIQGL